MTADELCERCGWKPPKDSASAIAIEQIDYCLHCASTLGLLTEKITQAIAEEYGRRKSRVEYVRLA